MNHAEQEIYDNCQSFVIGLWQFFFLSFHSKKIHQNISTMFPETAFVCPAQCISRPPLFHLRRVCPFTPTPPKSSRYSVLTRRICWVPKAELTQNDTAKVAQARMEKTIESVISSFNTVRTGRASPALLDRVTVSYYGTETPLNQLASVSISGTSSLIVEPYDKSIIGDIERALLESDVGLTPNNNGSIIRLTVPALTQERRVELVKQVKGMAEDGRVAVRNIRRDALDVLKKMEKNKELSKDESMSMQDEIQKLTDKFVKQIDQIYKQKDSDIMKV